MLLHRERKTSLPETLRHHVGTGMKHIETPIDYGGEITVGHIHGVGCAATAADGHNTLAMLTRREGETLNALLKRLDRALGRYDKDGTVVDEVNGD